MFFRKTLRVLSPKNCAPGSFQKSLKRQHCKGRKSSEKHIVGWTLGMRILTVEKRDNLNKHKLICSIVQH